VGSDGEVFGETDLKEAFENNGLHTVQPDNFSGFTEARRQLAAFFSSGNIGNKN